VSDKERQVLELEDAEKNRLHLVWSRSGRRLIISIRPRRVPKARSSQRMKRWTDLQRSSPNRTVDERDELPPDPDVDRVESR